MGNLWENSYNELLEVVKSIKHLEPLVYRAINGIIERLGKGGKILVCGNGGSASDAQHFVAEVVGRFKGERVGLPAIALTSDGILITAISNDYGYENVFSRQIEALGGPMDVLMAISTSGRSRSVNKAVEIAHRKGLFIIYLTGAENPTLNDLGIIDVLIKVPSRSTQRIQEIHRFILHVLAEGIEDAFVFKT
ncbi:MAG: D-sedoheptulose-7-phosphate isomerase [Candidatus Caldipriscus sp.]|jgi:D-sedoheptulose 7-phosphate isomerase|nr:SIS domain-containing protein [Candidatus Caldipriscus sp.]